jgi:hypothetical protein
MTNKSKILFSIFTLTILVNARPLNPENLPLLTQNHIRYTLDVGSTDPQKLRDLHKWLSDAEFDIAGVNLNRGEIEVITNADGIDFLREHGIKGVPMLMKAGIDSRYLNPATMEAKLKKLQQTYPQWTRLEQIGTSLESRPIYALLLSDTPAAGDARTSQKPSILIDGQHHAREIMTSELVSDIADTLLGSAGAGDLRALNLLHNWNIWLVPMLNVDGTNIVFTQDNMWRKNGRANGRNKYGVDLNRNYDFLWGKCKGSSTSQSAQDFRGASPASEPETQALQNLAAQIHPIAYMSYHSYSELIMYSYGCQGKFASDKELAVKLSKELADLLPTDDGRNKYKVGSPWEILYSTDGDSQDYMTGKFGALGISFEINQDFQPAYSMREPTLKKHRNAWGHFLDRLDQNLVGVRVVDGKTGQSVAAEIEVSNNTPDKDALPFSTNSAGYFFKVLEPGSYAVSAKLPDGRVATSFCSMNEQPLQLTLTVN